MSYSAVDASERVQPVGVTYGGAYGQAVLHRVEALAAVGVEMLGRADLLVLHDAVGLETVARARTRSDPRIGRT